MRTPRKAEDDGYTLGDFSPRSLLLCSPWFLCMGGGLLWSLAVKANLDRGDMWFAAALLIPGGLGLLIEGAFMVIAATSDTDVNVGIYDDAEKRAMLVNVVDVPPLCNFILPAIIRTGPLAIAISTAGASPALAKRIRNQIAEEYGEPYARLAVMLNDVRGWAKGTLPTYGDRKAFFESIVNGEPDPVELLRTGDEGAVSALIAAAQRTHEREARSAIR